MANSQAIANKPVNNDFFSCLSLSKRLLPHEKPCEAVMLMTHREFNYFFK